MIQLRIKEISKSKNIQLQELASMVGITRTSITNMIAGRQFPSADKLEAIANALGVEVYELFVPSSHTSSTLVCPHCGKPITIKVE